MTAKRSEAAAQAFQGILSADDPFRPVITHSNLRQGSSNEGNLVVLSALVSIGEFESIHVA
jgi:hypothetical protein